MKHQKNFNGKWFSVGSGTAVSMNHIKQLIDKKYNVVWEHSPKRLGDARHTLADIIELKEIGWEPKISIEEGLKRCFIDKELK
jgi:nucleoside-diphosphate-sugar epimerase